MRTRWRYALASLLMAALLIPLPAWAEEAEAALPFDVQEALPNVQIADISLEADSWIVKNQEATISFTLSAGDSPVADDLLAYLDEHVTYFLQNGPSLIPMERREDSWTYAGVLSFPAAGTYILNLGCTADTAEITPFLDETFMIDVINQRPVKLADALPDLPEELRMSAAGLREVCLVELSASELFSDPDLDEVLLSVSITDEAGEPVSLEETAQGFEVGGDSGMDHLELTPSATLIFTRPGTYSLAITGSDGVDAAEESYEATVTIVSPRAQWLKRLFIPFCAVVAVLMGLLARLIIKPSYKGKQITLAVSAGNWSQETTLDMAAWKRKKQPFAGLLTAAACPADEALYRPFAKVLVKPADQGVTLCRTQALTGRKTEQITMDDPFMLSVGGYDVTMTVSQTPSSSESADFEE